MSPKRRRRRAPRPRKKRKKAAGVRRNARVGQTTGTHATVPRARTARGGQAGGGPGRRAIAARVGKIAARLAVVSAVAVAAVAGVEQAYDYALTSPRFEASELVFEETPHVDVDRLRTLLDLEPRTNILSLDLEVLAETVAADPWVKRASVVRELPDTLIVEVEEHEAEAVLMSGSFFLLDASGMPFKRLEPGERGDLPVISGVDRGLFLSRPVEAHARLERAMEALRLYRERQVPALSEIHVGEGHELVLYTAARGTQLRLGRGNIEAALDRLETLRAALGAEFEGLAVVHLDGARNRKKDRIVASLFDEAAVVAAAPEVSPDEESERDGAHQPDSRGRHDWTRHGPRIPRYD